VRCFTESHRNDHLLLKGQKKARKIIAFSLIPASGGYGFFRNAKGKCTVHQGYCNISPEKERRTRKKFLGKREESVSDLSSEEIRGREDLRERGMLRCSQENEELSGLRSVHRLNHKGR